MKIRSVIIVFLACIVLVGCGKDFLDIKRNANQVVPQTIADHQAILDWSLVMNQTASFTMVCLGTDEYYIKDEVWNSISGANIYQKNGYVWAHDVYENNEVSDWNNAYQRILYANMALGVEQILPSPDRRQAWNTVKGQALFHRAWTFYQLAQTFCRPYDERTADKDLGIPLRLDFDATLKVGRGTLRETYDRILEDLNEALSLLPESVQSNFQPSKAAAHALLGRIYLEQGDYVRSLDHSSEALRYKSELLDYNALDFSLYLTFSNYLYGNENPEVIFYNHSGSGTALGVTRLLVDTNLYALYNDADLRKKAFFDEKLNYTGRYSGSSTLFTGLAVDELLLTRAECNLFLGKYEEVLSDLNYLLFHRYENGAFSPITELDPGKLMNIVLEERRKELYMRGTRWMDLRRLNRDPAFAKTLVRNVNGQQYRLLPGDNRWVWPIPDNEIERSGLEQNPR